MLNQTMYKKNARTRIPILGVQVDAITVQELFTYLQEQIRRCGKVKILNVNVNALNLAFAQPWLRNSFNLAELVFADGAGVILGSHILGYRIPERITYADWMWHLAEFAATNRFSFYFLGAKPGVAEKAAQKLLARFPSLCIVGTHHGYFDKAMGSDENEAAIRDINLCHPDILLVGFGMPVQEHWLMENWDRIEAKVALTGGAVFDYISGELPRPPRWMTDHGLEWLGRLMIEPRRLWRRYLVGNPLFFWRIFKHHILGIPLPNS